MTFIELVEKYEKYGPRNIMKMTGGWTRSKLAVHANSSGRRGWISFYRYGERFGQRRNNYNDV